MSRTLTLYDLTAEWLSIQTALVDAEGEITDEIADRLAAFDADIKAKTAGYIAVIRNLYATAEATKIEADRLAARVRVHANAADRMKSRLQFALEAAGLDEVDTPIGKAKVIRAGGKTPVTVLVEAEALPERFQRVRVSADKDALREALEALESDVLGLAELGERSKYLRIY